MSLKRIEFYKEDAQLFRLIKDSVKTTEVRALDDPTSSKSFYSTIQTGDEIEFFCGLDTITKKVGNVRRYQELDILLKNENIEDIEPSVNKSELKAKLLSFPNYPNRIKEYGLIAFDFADE